MKLKYFHWARQGRTLRLSLFGLSVQQGVFTICPSQRSGRIGLGRAAQEPYGLCGLRQGLQKRLVELQGGCCKLLSDCAAASRFLHAWLTAEKALQKLAARRYTAKTAAVQYDMST